MSSYEFGGGLYRTSTEALRAVADAWIYGGMTRPYPETLAADPTDLARECVAEWGLANTLAEWGEDEAGLTTAMAHAVQQAQSKLARS